MQQSQRQLGQNTSPTKQNELDIDSLQCLQQNQNWFAKFICLHHITAAVRYIREGVNNKNLFRYDKDYDKFIPTTRLRDIAMKRHQFEQDYRGFLNLLETELGAIILVIILSMLTAAATTVTIYYQQTLVQKIILQVSGQQYKFFGIIVGVVVFRFIIYNYLISLASNIAINTRVNLQNFYMRMIFMVNNDQLHTNLYKFRFLDIESIIQAVIFMPYMLISFCTIIGIIVLIFILNSNYGFIVFGIFLFSFAVLTLLMIATYRQFVLRQDTKIELVKKGKKLYQSLASMLFQNLTSRLLKNLVNLKRKSLNQDRYVNRAYILSQLAADSAVVVPIIIYYGLYYNGISNISLQNTYITAVYLGMVYFPFKLLVYGAYFIVKGAQNYQSILKDFKLINKRILKDLNSNLYTLNHHSYFDDIGDCFKYDYQIFHMTRMVSKKSLVEQMNRISRGEPALQKKLTSAPHYQALPIAEKQSNNITLCSYFECEQELDNYLKNLKVQIPKDKSLAIIDQSPFLMPESFLQNIFLYTVQNQEAYRKLKYILDLVDLGHIMQAVLKQQKTRLNQPAAKFYNWYQARLQLARALFHDVDFLIIRKYTIVRDTILMRRVLTYRLNQNQITIIVNRNNFQLLKQSGKIMLFTPHGTIVHKIQQILQEKSFYWNQILKRISHKVIKDKGIADHIKQQYLDLGPIKPIQFKIESSSYSKFFSLVHPGGFLVIMLVLAGPPCFKFYMSYLVGQSLKSNIYIIYLIFAVVYICFLLVKGLVLTGYLKAGSQQLYIKFIERMQKLKVYQIINMYKSQDISIESDFRKIDSEFLMNFQLGITSVLQSFVAIIIVSVGQPIYLAIALPVTIMSMIINILYTKIFNSLQSLKSKHLISVRSYVNACTKHSFKLFRYKKFEAIQKRFHQLNKISILFAANQIWILSGMRMIGQIIFIIGLVVFLIIMIQTQANKISNLPMVSLGVSLFLSLNFSYRFSIKTFSVIQTQLVALSKIFFTIQKPTDEFIIQNVSKQQSIKLQDICENQLKIMEGLREITFRDVVIDLGGKSTQKINFTLKRGDRISMSFDSKVLASIICGSLNPKIYGKPRRKGDIIYNSQSFIENVSIKVIILQDEPLLPIKGSVFQACDFLQSNIEKDGLTRNLQIFFSQIGLKPIFNPETLIESMPLPHKQILSIFKVVFYQIFEVLVLIGGLQDVSIVVREQIQDYLIRSKIPIVISVSNLISIVDRYQRHFLVQNMTLIEARSVKSQRKIAFFQKQRQ